METVCTKNNYELGFDEYDGYAVVDRESKVSYSLLEGKSLGGKATSDIVFIMKDAEFDDFGDLTIQEEFVDYFFGATFACNSDLEELLDHVVFYIERYLRHHNKKN